MPAELAEFQSELLQSIHLEAAAAGRFAEDAFFEWFCTHLIDAGEIDTADRAFYQGIRGIRIDGYGGDPATTDGTLNLIIADFSQSPNVERMTATELDAIFKRASNFLMKSLDRAFRNSLEETSAGFGLAELIASTWKAVSKVRILLISNRVLSERVDGRSAGMIEGKPVLYSVWDLGRLARFVMSGRTREEILVDFSDFGGALPALPAHLADADYEAYLAVMPGPTLAAIYDRWNARLLEQNVRVFLQARTSVNKGIRNTIDQDPEMFLAYNNGITATAAEVVTKHGTGGMEILKIRNLQIVNGGQTTASIFAASQKREASLSKVFVQMKLSVIPAERAEEVVPKISESANSQNKVNAADFFANHPFHLRFKKYSETILAPAPDGGIRNTKWFYERARGEYQDARGRLSASERKKFDLEHPKKQVITKTDLAKYLGVWEGLPHIVSRGAQKNFAQFAGRVGRQWAEDPDAFGEVYFRAAIAKAIVFRETETLVSSQPWYEGGYRANIVAYAIAKLAHDVAKEGRSVDFERIWKSQGMSVHMKSALASTAETVKVVIESPSGSVSNVSEWAKQQACWDRASELKLTWTKAWLVELISQSDWIEKEKEGRKEQQEMNGIEAQTAVVNAGAETWRQVKQWGVENKKLSQKEIDILTVAVSIPKLIPTDKQSLYLLNTLRKLREEGCPFGGSI